MGGYGSGKSDDAAASLVTWHRRVDLAVLVAIGLLLYASLRIGGGLGLAIGGLACCTALAPVLSERDRLVLRTDAPEYAVSHELSTPRNPLTCLWFANADRVEPGADGNHALLEASSLFGSQTFTVAVEDVDPTTHRLVIDKEGSTLVESTISVEGDAEGSRVVVETARDPVRPWQLASHALLQGPFERMLADGGYEVVEVSGSLHLRNPLP